MGGRNPEEEARETLKRRIMRYALLGEEIRWIRAEIRQCFRQRGEVRQGMAEQAASERAVEIMTRSYLAREKVLVRRLYRLQNERIQIDRMLADLEGEERSLLRMKLLEGRPWVFVSMKLFLSTRQCQRIQQRALDKILFYQAQRKPAAKRCRTMSEAGG